MADWADAGGVATVVSAVASAVAAVFAYRAAAKSADVAERAERRAAELERARTLSALLYAVDRVTVAAIAHGKLANSALASVRSRFVQSGGFGSSKQQLYQEEISAQCVKVADITKTVSALCPREEARYEGTTMADLIALHRQVDSMHLVLDEMMARLEDLREGQV